MSAQASFVQRTYRLLVQTQTAEGKRNHCTLFLIKKQEKMERYTGTHIVKRVQNASDGQHTYIVRNTVGQGGNIGVTYIYTEKHLQELLGDNTFEDLDELMPELDGQPDNLKALKVTTTIEVVPATELFTPIGAKEEKD